MCVYVCERWCMYIYAHTEAQEAFPPLGKPCPTMPTSIIKYWHMSPDLTDLNPILFNFMAKIEYQKT